MPQLRMPVVGSACAAARAASIQRTQMALSGSIDNAALRCGAAGAHEWASSLMRSLTSALLCTTYSQLGALQMVHALGVSGFEEVGVSCYSGSDAQLLECSVEEARQILGSAYFDY